MCTVHVHVAVKSGSLELNDETIIIIESKGITTSVQSCTKSNNKDIHLYFKHVRLEIYMYMYVQKSTLQIA